MSPAKPRNPPKKAPKAGRNGPPFESKRQAIPFPGVLKGAKPGFHKQSLHLPPKAAAVSHPDGGRKDWCNPDGPLVWKKWLDQKQVTKVLQITHFPKIIVDYNH